MGQIIKFPGPAPKFGHKRVKRRAARPENPGQLQLFSSPTAAILSLDSAIGLFEQALRLDERNDPGAGDLYRRAIDEGDCIADALCNLGILQSRRGEVPQAFDSFTAALKDNPRHFEAHYNLANMYFEVEDHRLARVHYQIAAEIDPGFPNLYFNLGLVLALENDFAAAVFALTSYQHLATPSEARKADELLLNLRKSLAHLKSTASTNAGS